MKSHRAFLIAPLLLASFAALANGQCTDPAPPRAGFAYKFEQDKSITFSDGYKTLANVLYPQATPGPCGWPLLLLIHGLTGSRKSPSLEAVALVSQGFFVVAYDVRAQGEARTLNPNKGSLLWALDEWIDMAEVIDWAGKAYKGVADTGRIGVFGSSQGGLHAWAAAAYSGRRLPPNTRRTALFPVIDAVAARFFSPEIVDVFVPDGTSFIYHLPVFAYVAQQPFALLQAGFRANLARYLDADDPAGLRTYLQSVSGKDFISELKQSDVPILAVAGWLDSWTDVNGVLRLFDQMRPTTPKRLYLATGSHGTPDNAYSALRYLFLTESWLKRYVKGSGGGTVEKGPPYMTALVPTDSTKYLSQLSLWRHRTDLTFPPRLATKRRFWLRKGGSLSDTVPDSSDGSFVVRHTVKSGYGARQFAADAALFRIVRQRIPLDNHVYESSALPKAVEIHGKPVASFWVVPNHQKFQVGVRLSVVPPSGPAQVVSTGALGVRQSSGPRPQRVQIELGAVGSLIPAQSKLRFEVRNLDVQKPLATDCFRRMPFFNDYNLTVHRDRGNESWLDLEVRPRTGAEIISFDTTISVSDPSQQRFSIRASPEWSGSLYVILLGISGQGPPIIFPTGSEFWFKPDFLTDFFLLSVNSPLQLGFAGLLDKNGEASCTLNLDFLKPLPTAFIGNYLQVAPTFFSWARGFDAGAPYRLRFR